MKTKERNEMTIYQCCFRNDAGKQAEYQVIQTDTDPAARKMALDMLRDRPQMRNVEVWRNGDFAFRLARCQLHVGRLPTR